MNSYAFRYKYSIWLTTWRGEQKKKSSPHIKYSKAKCMKMQKKNSQMTYQVNPIKFAFKAFKFSNSNVLSCFVYPVFFHFFFVRSSFCHATAFYLTHRGTNTSLDDCAFFFLGTFKFSVCYFDTRSCHKWKEEEEEAENGAIAQRDVYNNFHWHIRCILNKCTDLLPHDWCDSVLWSMIQWHNSHCSYTKISMLWCARIL